MEFIKMRYKSQPQNDNYHCGINHATSFDSFDQEAGVSPSVISSEMPPSYNHHMYDSTTACFSTATSGAAVSRHTATANNPVYATVNRQSLHKSSQRTKSTKDSVRRKDLPWVHVSPSSNFTDHQFRNYPNY
ncbi:hypothetical protein Ahia01_000336500 [Argonauta hians]